MREILTVDEAAQGLERIASEILARAGPAADLALVGIRRGGVPIAAWLSSRIAALTSVEVPIGSVDITLYRDDAAVALPVLHIGRSDVPFDVTRKRIVLVDDVLYTGRTVRAALHALLDYGRARSILLAAMVDRGGRELPIQPDFVVKRVDTPAPARIEVLAEDGGFRAVLIEP